MYKNNFDTSSTGTNIELSCFYDTCVSQHTFEENFSRIRWEDYYKLGMWYYTDWGNVPDHSNITFELHGTKAEMIRFLKDQRQGTVSNRKKEIYAADIDDYITSENVDITNYTEINDNYLKGYKLEYKPSKNLVKVMISGYSQGDAAYVLYCPEDLEKAWGTAPNEDDLRETFKRYFYDTPIYCTFTINGMEYYYTEFVDDDYEWDKETFAKNVAEASGVPYETLLAMLPKHPDYA